jgi:hypothetical protein
MAGFLAGWQDWQDGRQEGQDWQDDRQAGRTGRQDFWHEAGMGWMTGRLAGLAGLAG